MQNPELLITKILKARYFRQSSFMEAKLAQNLYLCGGLFSRAEKSFIKDQDGELEMESKCIYTKAI